MAGIDPQRSDSCRRGPNTPDDASWRGGGHGQAAKSLPPNRSDILQDRAAALTYYSVLSIFPALLVLVALLGLIGKSATQPLMTSLTSAAPQAVRTSSRPP